MLHILLPTDFSDQSWKAMSFASQLYHNQAVQFHLLHVVPVPITQSEVGVIPDMTDFIADAEMALVKLQGRFEDLEHHDSALFTSHVQLGSLADLIHKLEEEFPAKTMIVMGTRGASGLAEFFLGSTTTHLISHAVSPMVVVPEAAELKPIQHVILAVDDEGIQHKREILPLIEVLKQRDSRLKIIHVQTDNEAVLEAGSTTQLRLDQYLAGIDHAYDTLEGAYHEDALNQYAIKDNASLIALLKRDRGFWGNLFHRSLTKNMAFYGDIPLLILRGE